MAHPREHLHLGKQPATVDARDITLEAFKFQSAKMGIELPKHPAYFGHGTIFHDGNDPHEWGMNGNGPDDTVRTGFNGCGCCVWATKAHTVRAAARTAGRTVTITGKETVSDYSAYSGYDPDTGANDNGSNMRDAHKYHQQIGILDAHGTRHKIGGYISIDPTDPAELLEAAWIFSAAEIGFAFTAAQYDQFDTPANVVPVWDYVAGSQEEGGHAISFHGHAKAGDGGVSWERHLWLTDAFLTHQVDEAWALIYLDELRNGKTERGYDLSAMNVLLSQIGQ